MIRPVLMVMMVLTAGELARAASLPGAEPFLEGTEFHRTGKYREAHEAFEEAAAAGGPLAPYARIRQAEVRAAAGQEETAVSQLQALLEQEAFDAGAARLAHFTLGVILAGEEEHAAAARHFERAPHTVLEEADPWWYDAVQWAIAENRVALAPDDPASYGHFRHVVETTFYYKPRLEASRMLMHSPSADDKLLAVIGHARAGHASDAGKMLAGLLPAMAANELSKQDVSWMQSLLLAASPSADARAQALDKSWMRIALAYGVRQQASRGNFGRARTLADLLVGAAGDTRETGDALWWLAEAYEEAGELGSAVETHVELAASCPAHRKADDSLLAAAVIQVERGRLDEARALFAQLHAEWPYARAAGEGWFRLGELEKAQGNVEAARMAFRQGASWRPGDFYAHRCAEALAQLEGGDAGGPLPVARGESFVRPLIHAVSGPAGLPSSVTESAAYRRMAFLGAHGLKEGEWDAFGFLLEPPAGAAARDVYNALAAAGFAYSASQYADAANWGVGERGRPSEDRLRLDYALVHWETVRALGTELNVDPYLLLAIGRQESTFRPGLTSHAGASGLMQVMPSTAEWLAEADSRIEPEHTSNLMHPGHSLRLGAVYIRRMLDRYDGNLARALAGYNAGPGNVNKWLRRYGDIDVASFVDVIPFDETKHYVKRVLANYAAYHTLYPSEREHAVAGVAAAGARETQ